MSNDNNANDDDNTETVPLPKTQILLANQLLSDLLVLSTGPSCYLVIRHTLVEIAYIPFKFEHEPFQLCSRLNLQTSQPSFLV